LKKHTTKCDTPTLYFNITTYLTRNVISEGLNQQYWGSGVLLTGVVGTVRAAGKLVGQ
jgi:hypothetical protein